MNLEPIHRELLWMYCDEFPTLPKMDDLPLSLTNTRKFGLCHFLGLQDIPQLEEKYGEKIARSIISALQTKVFYRVNENETAKRMSEILGQMEVAEKICLEVWGLMIQETVIVLLLKGENALLFYHLKL